MEINGKKAIVFGGTSGIGLATVQQLMALGAEVVALGRDEAKASALPAGATFIQCDVRSRESLQAFYESQGSFDILVSAATGGSRAIGKFAEMDMDGYASSFDKLWGYTNVVRYGLETLSDNGCVVLVSGSPARRCGPGQVALSSVGGAVEAFSRAVAKEITPKRINVMSPGLIDTPMVPLKGQERDAHYDRLTGNNLIARAGTPDECAQGVLFLIQNDFVTGTTLDVDGGILLS
ncbi:SDR family oxidoreductase [Granulosicoccus sp.]|jgi:NAD(P)-dependent dehydrogenase (short-subunit alcohol dehydrogenase family)|nr:SDR family oxidoreductase [Granulosicoccus sp.]MDB4222618.1 SDR family oxidoreductase [Granulosicoccus sp.]